MAGAFDSKSYAIRVSGDVYLIEIGRHLYQGGPGWVGKDPLNPFICCKKTYQL